MRRGIKPSINTSPPANAYTGPRERIVEYFDREAQAGGLISFARNDAGQLVVYLYRHDPNVKIVVGRAENEPA